MNPPDTAPRDGTPFLGNFNYPWLLMTMWNWPSGKWAVAMVEWGMYHGEPDPHFEGDFLDEKDLLGWLPLPPAR